MYIPAANKNFDVPREKNVPWCSYLQKSKMAPVKIAHRVYTIYLEI